MYSNHDTQADPWVEFFAYAGVAIIGFLISPFIAELFVDGTVQSAVQGLKTAFVG